jgi:hypothetical protein
MRSCVRIDRVIVRIRETFGFFTFADGAAH